LQLPLCDSCNPAIAYCICRDEDTPSNLDRRFLVKRLLDIGCSALASVPFCCGGDSWGCQEKLLIWEDWEIESPEASDTEVQFLIFLFVQNTAVYNK
jgi:hypothetical protein